MLNEALQWPPANTEQVLMLGRTIDCLRDMGLDYDGCQKVVGAILDVKIDDIEWETQMQKVDHHESQAWRIRVTATVTSANDPSTWSHDAIMDELVNHSIGINVSAIRLRPTWEIEQ